MKRIANSLKEFSAGNKMRAHPMGEWASARKHARAKLYNKLLGCRGATPAFSSQVSKHARPYVTPVTRTSSDTQPYTGIAANDSQSMLSSLSA